MTLTPGVRLGAYQVVSLLGAGGMGEVYRARDLRLGREVAIKVLPAAFSADPERLQRFEQEARAASALNHPNICTVYDVGEVANPVTLHFIVSELLEGDTLRERFKAGPLPTRKAVEYAVQIAHGLAAAHEKGITHRDLKPENLFITNDGRVKILDFGLAKLTQAEPALAGLSALPTTPAFGAPQVKPDTLPGMVLGTIGYMAPEQVRGLPADHRSDIFAFGAILYEMLSGRRAFRGDTTMDAMTAILKEDPPDLPVAERHLPPALTRIVDRCLEKSPAARFQTATDLAFALEGLSSQSAVAAAVTPAVISTSRQPKRTVWALAVVAAVITAAAIAFGTLYFRGIRGTDTNPVRFAVSAPPNIPFGSGVGQSIPAVSPDGRRLAFVVGGAGVALLWVRSLDALEARPLPGTENATLPFWSPDSRTIGFFAPGGTLKSIDASGGPVRTVCNRPGDSGGGAGGTWSSDGVIIFGSSQGGLFRVSANGGTPTPLTHLDTTRGNTSHRFPWFLPDGRHFLYSSQSEVLLASLDSTSPIRLLTADSQAVYAQGSLLFVRQGALVSQPFDAQRGTLTGTEVSIAEQVLSDGSGGAAFAASSSGVLAYRTGQIAPMTQLSWVDRVGRSLGAIGSPGRYRNPILSPDGTRVAVDATDPQSRAWDIWLVELGRGLASRFTFDPGNDRMAVWSPDASLVMFTSDRGVGGGSSYLYQKRANGVGSEELVLKSDFWPLSWSPDGRYVVSRVNASSRSLQILHLVDERKPHPFDLSARFSQLQGQVSPDGRWIAYTSAESGRNEIYIQSFPTPGGGKWQISKDGGGSPRWRRDGRELFYYALNGRLMAVPITAVGSAMDIGSPVSLFEPHLLGGPNPLSGLRQQYDVARDGQRFLLNVPLEGTSESPMNVVVNWTAGLKK